MYDLISGAALQPLFCVSVVQNRDESTPQERPADPDL